LKLINLTFALMLLFSSVIANAFPEDVTTGSYKVLFDMGLSQTSYRISIDDPKDSETITGIPKTDYIVNGKLKFPNYGNENSSDLLKTFAFCFSDWIDSVEQV
jgi:hypothetical protein